MVLHWLVMMWRTFLKGFKISFFKTQIIFSANLVHLSYCILMWNLSLIIYRLSPSLLTVIQLFCQFFSRVLNRNFESRTAQNIIYYSSQKTRFVWRILWTTTILSRYEPGRLFPLFEHQNPKRRGVVKLSSKNVLYDYFLVLIYYFGKGFFKEICNEFALRSTLGSRMIWWNLGRNHFASKELWNLKVLIRFTYRNIW